MTLTPIAPIDPLLSTVDCHVIAESVVALDDLKVYILGLNNEF